jgi:glycosyltransferase involved in cell wall biosynthesis
LTPGPATPHGPGVVARSNERPGNHYGTGALSNAMDKTVRILGTPGIPAAYGGFETTAQNISRFLVGNGWRVVVYCQIDGKGPIKEDVWHGVERVLIPVTTPGWLGTSKFDLISVLHASRFRDICLTFGYNTAIFNVLQRVKGIPNVINMDGIEWSRARWGLPRQAIRYANERIGCVVGAHLIADHPELEKHLLTRVSRRKISMITYGADTVTEAPPDACLASGLRPGRYLTVVARPIPENSILEIVGGFSAEPRGYQLAVLGDVTETDNYHRAVRRVASDEVVFLGRVYDPPTVKALRFHSVCQVHGHTVGGTNPSLVEAMAAGNLVIAHDNPYNRWVAQDAAVYLRTTRDVSELVHELPEPGFITMNLPRLLDPLDHVGIDNPIVCTNINKIGFRIGGGFEAYERALQKRRFHCRRDVGLRIRRDSRPGSDLVGLYAAEHNFDRVRNLQPSQHPQHAVARRGVLGNTVDTGKADRIGARLARGVVAGIVLALSIAGCSDENRPAAAAPELSVSPNADGSKDTPTDVGTRAPPVEDPIAPPPTPVIRNGVRPTPTISAAPAPFDQPVEYPDGITLRILAVDHGTTVGEGPGVFPGQPKTILDIELSNASNKNIDMNQVVVTVIYGDDRRLARPIYDEDVQDFSGTVGPGDSIRTSYAFSIPDDALADVMLTIDFDGVHAAATFEGDLG